MAKQLLDLGVADNDPAAEPLRAALAKVNANFGEVYAGLPPPRVVEFCVGPHATAPRQLLLTVPPGCHWIGVDGLYGPGGSSGGGSLLTGANVSGSGGASCGEVIEGVGFVVTPGEVLAVQVGHAGSYGIQEQAAGSGSETYIKRGSHAGPYVQLGPLALRCRAGLAGAPGTSAGSGAGAAPVGPNFAGGGSPAGGASRATEGSGLAGGSQDAWPLRYIPQSDRALNGGAAGSGGFRVAASATAAGGGAAGIALGGWPDSPFGGVGGLAPNRPGGGAAPGLAALRVRHTTHASRAGLQGGSIYAQGAGTSGDGGDARNGICPGQGASGAAAGGFGNRGADGYVRLVLACSDEAFAALPPVEIIYAGAGRTVPEDYVGIHLGYRPHGRSCTLTGVTSGGNAGKILRSGAGLLLAGDVYQFRFTGTAPEPFVAGTLYYAVGEGSNHFFVRETPTGPTIACTSAGSGGTNTLDDVEPLPQFGAGVRRQLDVAEFDWRHLDPLSADSSAANRLWFDEWVADCVAAGQSVMYSLVGVPSYAVVSSSPAATLTVAPNAVGPATISADVAAFGPYDPGRWIVAGAGRAVILAYTSATQVSVQIKTAFAGDSLAAGSWTLGPSGLADNLDHVNAADAPSYESVRDFIIWLVNRYNVERHPAQKPIRFIGTYNEPLPFSTGSGSAGGGPTFRGSLMHLAQMARAVKAGISAVGTPALTGDIAVVAPEWGAGQNSIGAIHRGAWFAEFLQADDGTGSATGASHVDAVAVHAYNFVSDTRAYESGIKFGQTIKRLDHDIRHTLRGAGVAGWESFPILNTEWGLSERTTQYPHLPPALAYARSLAEQAAYGWALNCFYAWRFVEFGAGIQIDAAMQQAAGDLHNHLAGRVFTRAERLQSGAIRFTLDDASVQTYGEVA